MVSPSEDLTCCILFGRCLLVSTSSGRILKVSQEDSQIL